MTEQQMIDRLKWLKELIQYLPVSKTGKHLIEMSDIEKKIKCLSVD